MICDICQGFATYFLDTFLDDFLSVKHRETMKQIEWFYCWFFGSFVGSFVKDFVQACVKDSTSQLHHNFITTLSQRLNELLPEEILCFFEGMLIDIPEH